MDGDIVERMRTEEADLMRKLAAVRGFLSAYGEAPAKSVRQESQSPKPGGAREKIELDAFGEYGRQTVVEAMRVMLTAKHPMKTRAIVEVLQAAEYQINGENPVNALGALLARSVDIVSHGKRGWSLIDPDKIRKIVGDTVQNEIEAPNGNANGASIVADQGAATPGLASWIKPNPWPAARESE